MNRQNLQSLRFAAAAAVMAVAGSAMAQASDPSAQITAAITTILGIIAVGGAGFVTLKLALVGWTVGAKFIGRLGGKA